MFFKYKYKLVYHLSHDESTYIPQYHSNEHPLDNSKRLNQGHNSINQSSIKGRNQAPSIQLPITVFIFTLWRQEYCICLSAVHFNFG